MAASVSKGRAPGRNAIRRRRIVERDSTSRHTIRYPRCHSRIHLESEAASVPAWPVGGRRSGNGRRDRVFVCVDDAEAIFGGLLCIPLPWGVGTEESFRAGPQEATKFAKNVAARTQPVKSSTVARILDATSRGIRAVRLGTSDLFKDVGIRRLRRGDGRQACPRAPYVNVTRHLFRRRTAARGSGHFDVLVGCQRTAWRGQKPLAHKCRTMVSIRTWCG